MQLFVYVDDASWNKKKIDVDELRRRKTRQPFTQKMINSSGGKTCRQSQAHGENMIIDTFGQLRCKCMSMLLYFHQFLKVHVILFKKEQIDNVASYLQWQS